MSAPVINAVIIGINSYPFVRQAEIGSDLRPQLVSPVPSALAFAEWLRGSRAGTIPLGLLKVLVSDNLAGNPSGTERATGDNIMEALVEWQGACHANPNAIGLIFYVGHALGRGVLEPWLLAEDYGADPTSPLNNAIDLSSVIEVMKRSRARALCVMADCCRENYSGDLKNLQLRDGHEARGLQPIPGRGSGREAPWLKLFSVEPGVKSELLTQVLINDRSYFTEAILKLFEGAGATKKSGQWVVTTEHLSSHFRSAMQRVLRTAKAKAKSLRLNWDDQIARKMAPSPIGLSGPEEILHHLAGLPAVPLWMTCEPPETNDHAHMSAHNKKTNRRYQRAPQPSAGAWDLDACCGVYDLAVSFPQNNFPAGQKEDEMVYPPNADFVF